MNNNSKVDILFTVLLIQTFNRFGVVNEKYIRDVYDFVDSHAVRFDELQYTKYKPSRKTEADFTSQIRR